MTKLETLKQMDASFGLINLFRMGAVAKKVIFHKDVYEKYDTFIVQGYEEAEAKVLTARYFKVTLRAVQIIVKEMK